MILRVVLLVYYIGIFTHEFIGILFCWFVIIPIYNWVLNFISYIKQPNNQGFEHMAVIAETSSLATYIYTM